MSRALTTKRVLFPKVAEARKALAEKSVELMELQVALIKEAAAKGQLDAALKANQWLIEHAPTDDSGPGIVGASAVEVRELDEPTSRVPSIQIGIQLGKVEDGPKQITGEVIDIKPNE
jgi:hypothetical protein